MRASRSCYGALASRAIMRVKPGAEKCKAIRTASHQQTRIDRCVLYVNTHMHTVSGDKMDFLF